MTLASACRPGGRSPPFRACRPVDERTGFTSARRAVWNRTWKIVSYGPMAPRRLLLRFTIPTFIAVLLLALPLGAAPYWAAVAASVSAIVTEPVVDAVWVRTRPVSEQHQ